MNQTSEGRSCLRQNIGDADRLLRITAGVALAAWPVLAGWPSWSVAALSAIGGMWIVEGIIRY